MKRTKGKSPDVELRLGSPLDDDLIRDKATFFAHTVGSSKCQAKIDSASWLGGYKQRNYRNGNGIQARKIACDPDNFDAVDGIPISEPKSGSETPDGTSPISSDILQHSRSPKLEHVEPPDDCIGFPNGGLKAHAKRVRSAIVLSGAEK